MKRPSRTPAPTVVRRLSTPAAPPVVPGAPPSAGYPGQQVYRRPEAPGSGPNPLNRPRPPSAGTPAAAAPAPKPAFRPRPTSGPPTREAIQALADKERVPLRIARGELEGQMPCHRWRRKEAAHAAAYDAAYAMVAKHPDLTLDVALSLVANHQDAESFLAARRAAAGRTTKIEESRPALKSRTKLDNSAIETYLQGLIERQRRVALLSERWSTLGVLRTITKFELTGDFGAAKKQELLALGTPEAWLALSATPRGMELDPVLTAAPKSVAASPKQRPVYDPRPLLEKVGQVLELRLLNGVTLTAPLCAVGGFDVLIGKVEDPVLVFIHGLAGWTSAPPA